MKRIDFNKYNRILGISTGILSFVVFILLKTLLLPNYGNLFICARSSVGSERMPPEHKVAGSIPAGRTRVKL